MTDTWVFAYGSNMDLEDVARWCRENQFGEPQVHEQTVATLDEHRLAFNYRSWARRGGACNVMAHSAQRVWGLVLRVDAPVLNALDAKEGAAYRRVEAPLWTRAGRAQTAWVYEVLEHRREPGLVAPRAHYLDIVVRAAERHGFPADYVEALRRTPSINDDD